MIISLSGCRNASRTEHFRAESSAATESSSEEQVAESVCVYVCGEVEKPGVYELPHNSRVKDAIALAGGLTAEADAAAINQASVLKDQEKIVVPATGSTKGPASASAGGLLDINAATKEQLVTLPGIGQTRAAAIISFREKNGGFRSIEDLLKVEGIKTGTFNKIKDSIIC